MQTRMGNVHIVDSRYPVAILKSTILRQRADLKDLTTRNAHFYQSISCMRAIIVIHQVAKDKMIRLNQKMGRQIIGGGLLRLFIHIWMIQLNILNLMRMRMFFHYPKEMLML